MNENTNTTSTVSAFPTKRFFVGMFTRDIELDDAILDLLDNCVDGLQRTLKHRAEAVVEKNDIVPENGAIEAINVESKSINIYNDYSGFKANVEFNKEFFRISDNCGGIPRNSGAFRLGNSNTEKDKGLATIGYYGIGMKRAVFKLGRNCTITTNYQGDAYRVVINKDWLENDTNWDLPVEVLNAVDVAEGTIIEVTDLYDSISNKFDSAKTESFINDFEAKVSTHYSYIIHKHFSVTINNQQVEPQFVEFQFSRPTGVSTKDKGRIAPYVYEGLYNDVKIELICGFYRNLPTVKEIEDDLKGRNEKEKAGWTIICNDRVVEYCNKDKLTGWGETGVPKYHTQFVSIAGIVRFSSTEIDKLPLTTTKRGIDAASDTYLTVKNIMREALKIFTNHTNKWKGPSDERDAIVGSTIGLDPFQVASHISDEEWKPVNKDVIGKKFIPNLPEPENEKPTQTIRFSRPVGEIKQVADYLFGDPTVPNAQVGEKCFSMVLVAAQD